MNPHDVLQVKPDATPEEIRVAFYRLAKTWHPDRFQGDEKAMAEGKFRELVGAFNAIGNQSFRRGAHAAGPMDKPGGSPTPDATPVPRNREPEDWFREAQEASAVGDPERALGLVLMALRGREPKAEYHMLHAELLCEAGCSRHEAVKAMEAALALKPNRADILIKLALLYESSGMPARASTLFQKARDISPHHTYFRSEARRARAVQGPPPGLWGQVKVLAQKFLHHE